MTEPNPAPTGSQADTLQDRRRPGRAAVREALLPLLRNPGDPAFGRPDPVRAIVPMRDDLAPAVGIARGIGVMGVTWIGLALLVHHLTH